MTVFQAELAGGQDKLVRAEGVKGGDLLWLLSPSESQSSSWEQATCTQPVPEHEAKHQRLTECPGNVAKDQPLGSGDAPPHEADIMREEANGHSSTEEPMEEIGIASQSAELLQDRPALSLSDYFALVKEANSNGGHLLLCALHATLLEAGWVPAWSIQVCVSFLARSFGGMEYPLLNQQARRSLSFPRSSSIIFQFSKAH